MLHCSRCNSLPIAKPVAAENVVYAIVHQQEDEGDDSHVNWELVLVVGFMIY
jgi:hypothetical protein